MSNNKMKESTTTHTYAASAARRLLAFTSHQLNAGQGCR